MRHVMYSLLGAVFALGMLLFTGCGGGDSGDTSFSESPDSMSTSYTSASVKIDWPARDRSLPYLAESLAVEITGPNNFHVSHLANRPTAGGHSEISFTKVPVGQLTIHLLAYPETNARGTRLAIGQLLLTAKAGTELDIPVSLNSTIDQLDLSPRDAAFPDGTSKQFTANGRNASGAWVPVAPRNVSWASSDISIATVSQSGLVIGVRPGRVLISATEAESGKSADIEVTITNDHVRVQPTALTLDLGESHDFTAEVTGLSSENVVWSIDEAPGGGTIDDQTGAYTAPLSTGVYHVTATSTVNPEIHGTATITVIDAQVEVTPAFPRVNIGHTVQMTSRIVNTTDQRVTWSIFEGNAGGSITENGLYTPPAQSGTYHIVATCVAHPQKAMTVSVVVTDIHISVTPLDRKVNVGGQLALTASVTGSINFGVNWSIREGLASGMITADGLNCTYTAPPFAGTYTVIATSKEDQAISVAIPVTVESMQVVGEIN